MKERNQEWISLATKLNEVKQKIAYLNKERIKLDKKLQELSEYTDSCGGGFEYKEVERPGSINYKDIPALKDLDLSAFRNDSVKFWKLMFKPLFEDII